MVCCNLSPVLFLSLSTLLPASFSSLPFTHSLFFPLYPPPYLSFSSISFSFHHHFLLLPLLSLLPPSSSVLPSSSHHPSPSPSPSLFSHCNRVMFCVCKGERFAPFFSARYKSEITISGLIASDITRREREKGGCRSEKIFFLSPSDLHYVTDGGRRALEFIYFMKLPRRNKTYQISQKRTSCPLVH